MEKLCSFLAELPSLACNPLPSLSKPAMKHPPTCDLSLPHHGSPHSDPPASLILLGSHSVIVLTAPHLSTPAQRKHIHELQEVERGYH